MELLDDHFLLVGVADRAGRDGGHHGAVAWSEAVWGWWSCGCRKNLPTILLS
jgi:hypothetical protein